MVLFHTSTHLPLDPLLELLVLEETLEPSASDLASVSLNTTTPSSSWDPVSLLLELCLSSSASRDMPDLSLAKTVRKLLLPGRNWAPLLPPLFRSLSQMPMLPPK